MLKNEQHPIYGGLLVQDQQAVDKYKIENDCRWLIFPECIATNGKCWIVLCFIDYTRGLVLFRKKPPTSKKIKLIESNYPLPAEVRLVSLLITGLNPVPINEAGEFEQIGGPIKYTKSREDSDPNKVVKFLYMILDFEEILKNPNEFIWVKSNLVKNIFTENNFFRGDRFDALLEKIEQLEKDSENLKM